MSSLSPSTDDPVVIEFQARRRHVWRLIQPWAVAGVAGGLAMALALKLPNAFSENVRFWLIIGGFAVVGLSIAVASLHVSHHYTCPACGQTPMSGRGGIELDPSQCPRCGAILK